MKRLKIEYNHEASAVTWFMSAFATVPMALWACDQFNLLEFTNWWHLVLMFGVLCFLAGSMSFLLSIITSVIFGKVIFEDPDNKQFPYVTKQEAKLYRQILENFYLDPELVCRIFVLPKFSLPHLKKLIYSHHQKYERTLGQTNSSIIEILAKGNADDQTKRELLSIMVDLLNGFKTANIPVQEFDFSPNRMEKSEYFYRKEMGSNDYGLFAKDIPIIKSLIAEFDIIKGRYSF